MEAGDATPAGVGTSMIEDLASSSAAGAPPKPGPGQCDHLGVLAAPVKDALRSIRQIDDGPVALQLDHLAAIDGPYQAGAAEVHEGTIAVAAEQSQRVPI